MAYKYLREYAQIRLENDSGAILAENGDIFVTDGSSPAITDRYLLEDGSGVYLLDSLLIGPKELFIKKVNYRISPSGVKCDMNLGELHSFAQEILNPVRAIATEKELMQSNIKQLNANVDNADKVDGKHASDLCGVINWLSTSIRLTGGTDYIVDGAWTELDLTAYTSANAKFILMQLRHNTTATAGDIFGVRKNGDAAVYYPAVDCQVTGKIMRGMITVAMDSGQVIEYWATDASDTVIDILGYIE